MRIKAESYKIFSEIYCPIVPAPLELYFGDRCRSVVGIFDILTIGPIWVIIKKWSNPCP